MFCENALAFLTCTTTLPTVTSMPELVIIDPFSAFVASAFANYGWVGSFVPKRARLKMSSCESLSSGFLLNSILNSESFAAVSSSACASSFIFYHWTCCATCYLRPLILFCWRLFRIRRGPSVESTSMSWSKIAAYKSNLLWVIPVVLSVHGLSISTLISFFWLYEGILRLFARYSMPFGDLSDWRGALACLSGDMMPLNCDSSRRAWFVSGLGAPQHFSNASWPIQW